MLDLSENLPLNFEDRAGQTQRFLIGAACQVLTLVQDAKSALKANVGGKIVILIGTQGMLLAQLGIEPDLWIPV